MFNIILLIVTLVAIGAAVWCRGLARAGRTKAGELREKLAGLEGRRWSPFPGVVFGGGTTRPPTMEEVRGTESELLELLDRVQKFRTAMEAAQANPQAVRESEKVIFRLAWLGKAGAKGEWATSWHLKGVGWYVYWACSNDGQGGLVSAHGADEAAARAAAMEAEKTVGCPCGNFLTGIYCEFGEYPR